MKIYKNQLSPEEYNNIIHVINDKCYEVNIDKIPKGKLLQCPMEDTFVSSVQEDGSVLCEIIEGKIEKNDKFWKNQAIQAKENLIKLQSSYNDISQDVDKIHNKQAVYRTDKF